MMIVLPFLLMMMTIKTHNIYLQVHMKILLRVILKIGFSLRQNVTMTCQELIFHWDIYQMQITRMTILLGKWHMMK